MDLGDWLRSLGLEQYEAVFRENAIDGTILARLTAEDLKDLGIGLVGHRRKLLDAIAALGIGANPRPAPANVIQRTDGTLKEGAERRQAGIATPPRQAFAAKRFDTAKTQSRRVLSVMVIRPAIAVREFVTTYLRLDRCSHWTSDPRNHEET